MLPSIRTRCSSFVCVHRSSSPTPSSSTSALRQSLSLSKVPPTRSVMPNRRFHSAEATVSSSAAASSVPAVAPSTMTPAAGTTTTTTTAAATRALSKKTKKPFVPALQQQQQQQQQQQTPSSSLTSSISSSSSAQQPTPHWNSGSIRPKVRPFASEQHPQHPPSLRPYSSGPKSKREPRIQPIMAHKQSRPGHSRHPPAVRAASPPVHGEEELSPSIQILCEAMAEGKIRRVKNLPPIFLASTYQEAEMMMQLFTDYYQATQGKNGPGPVGLDTETTTTFITKVQQEVSLIQIATQEVCLLFQIYNILGVKQKKKIRFPPRLKAFLEDPKQLMCGVGIIGDAQGLRKDYGVNCQGLVELSQLATERKILGTSLADLDGMYGRPGREVIKTRKILGWNWDREVLDPKWIWYAAKDAFAGVAIYENMLAGQLKPGYQTFAQRFPMTEDETAEEILDVLVKICGKGKPVTVNALLNSISKYYGRFRKVYQPEQRYSEAQRYLQKLVRDGKVVPVREHEVAGGENYILHKNDRLQLPGVEVSTLLRTPEGLAAIKSFFNDREVDLSTLSPKCMTTTAPEHPEEEKDVDLKDLRMFLDFAAQWDLPRRFAAMTNVYFQAISNVENDKIYKEELLRLGLDPAQYPVTRSERLQAAASAEQGQTLGTEQGDELEGNQDVDNNDDMHKEAAALMSSSSLADDPAQAQPETSTTMTLTSPIDRSTLPKAQLNKTQVKQAWSEFLSRLEKRGLIKQENGFYVLTPAVKTRLMFAANVNESQDQLRHPWTIVVPGDGTEETNLTPGDSASSSNPFQDDGPEKRLRLDTSVIGEEEKQSEAVSSL